MEATQAPTPGVSSSSTQSLQQPPLLSTQRLWKASRAFSFQVRGAQDVDERLHGASKTIREVDLGLDPASMLGNRCHLSSLQAQLEQGSLTELQLYERVRLLEAQHAQMRSGAPWLTYQSDVVCLYLYDATWRRAKMN